MSRPRSNGFLGQESAPSISDGFDVFGATGDGCDHDCAAREVECVAVIFDVDVLWRMRLPTTLDERGFCIFESNAILWALGSGDGRTRR